MAINQGPPPPHSPPAPPPPPPDNAKIKHIFVLVMENRSYDHFLGYSEYTGTDTQTGTTTTAEGLGGDIITTIQSKQTNRQYPLAAREP
jgi:phospholipase C